MQSRRDRVMAHNFTVGRLGTAMLEADPDAVDALLTAGDRALDGRAAPARGLTLERVIYPKSDGGPTSARGRASDTTESTATETKEQES